MPEMPEVEIIRRNLVDRLNKFPQGAPESKTLYQKL